MFALNVGWVMYLPKLLSPVVLAVFLAGGCGVTRAVKKVPGAILGTSPKVELRCTPKVGMGATFGPVPFTAVLRVKNPGEALWCPAVEWYVDGTFVSGHESDCDPYDVVVAKEGREPEAWNVPVKYFGFRRGDHTITAKLLHAGDVIASKDCGVTAR